MSKKIKTTITLAGHIKDFASSEAKSLGLDFSAYITVLIAEKMRGPLISPHNNANNEVAITSTTPEKEVIKIDSEQENEIDRLLQW